MEGSGQLPPPSPHHAGSPDDYPLTLSVDYPDRRLDRVTSFFRIFTVIPIAVVAAAIEGGSYSARAGDDVGRYAVA